MIELPDFIFFMVGLMVGCGLTYILTIHISSGDLRVDNSDDQTHLFLELKENVGETVKKRFVVLKVIVKDFLPKKD
nr:MAG TPA: hypothetical protein [Caudoviricetes sp.]